MKRPATGPAPSIAMKPLHHDPGSEELYCRIMTCQAAQGYLGDARATCQRCAETLAELGGIPKPCQAEALLKRLLGQAPSS